MILTETLSKAWKAFTQNKRYLIPIVLLEFVFLFLLVYFHFTFLDPANEAVLRAGEIMQQEIEKIPESEVYQLQTILTENEEFMAAFTELLTRIIFFIFTSFALWIVFKTPVWYFAHKSVYNKMPLKTNLIKFPLLSLFWFVAFIFIFIIYSIATGSTATILPLFTSAGTMIIMYLIFLAAYYFSQVSFALIPAQQTFKKTFTLGVKHARAIIPAFIVNTIIAFIVLSLPFNWIQTIPLLALAIIILITIPALAFTRIHMIVATWQQK